MCDACSPPSPPLPALITVTDKGTGEVKVECGAVVIKEIRVSRVVQIGCGAMSVPVDYGECHLHIVEWFSVALCADLNHAFESWGLEKLLESVRHTLFHCRSIPSICSHVRWRAGGPVLVVKSDVLWLSPTDLLGALVLLAILRGVGILRVELS
eukprot:6198355-Pleurochrysis_carterae.AAC.2